MKRFHTTQRGYKYDRLIFWFSMFAILGLVFYNMYQYNFDFSTRFYFECDKEICKNPLYNLTDCSNQLNILFFIPLYKADDCRKSCIESWCDQPYIKRGEYGKKPNFLLRHMFLFVILSFVLSFILNHLIHNKGRQFDIEIPVTKKLIINRDKLKEWSKKKIEDD